MPPRRAATPRLAIGRAVIRARPGDELSLAVVADTHSHPHPMTATRIRALAPDAILHAGDIGDRSVLDELTALAPLHAVRGNIDGAMPGVPDALVIDVVRAGAEPRPVAPAAAEEEEGARPAGDPTTMDDFAPADRLLRLLLLHIAVAGPRLRAEVARLATSHGASLIVCGHSHVPFIGRERGLAMFNPGSVGPRRFQLPIVLGELALAHGRVRLAHIDCETGAPWSPP
jgi:predicted phosphodiesterase